SPAVRGRVPSLTGTRNGTSLHNSPRFMAGTFAFGLQYEQTFDNYLQTNIGGGIVSFGGSWTGSLAANQPGTVLGNDYADFLLGYGLGIGAAFGNQTSGLLTISKPTAGKQTYRALYFGDTWKVTHKLTLNLGLRYELAGP